MIAETEVTPDELTPCRSEGVLAGIALQRAFEHAAFVATGGERRRHSPAVGASR